MRPVFVAVWLHSRVVVKKLMSLAGQGAARLGRECGAWVQTVPPNPGSAWLGQKPLLVGAPSLTGKSVMDLTSSKGGGRVSVSSASGPIGSFCPGHCVENYCAGLNC